MGSVESLTSVDLNDGGSSQLGMVRKQALSKHGMCETESAESTGTRGGCWSAALFLQRVLLLFLKLSRLDVGMSSLGSRFSTFDKQFQG